MIRKSGNHFCDKIMLKRLIFPRAGDAGTHAVNSVCG
jgi:hypothetical protein